MVSHFFDFNFNSNGSVCELAAGINTRPNAIGLTVALTNINKQNKIKSNTNTKKQLEIS